MSAVFSTDAAHLAGLVPRLLGWMPEQFWNATPAELGAVLHAGDAGEGQPLSRAELEHLLERERHG